MSCLCNVEPLTAQFYKVNWGLQRYSGSITSVGEERANLSGVVYLRLCGFCLERFPLPLGVWDGLRYFIVALPEPSI